MANDYNSSHTGPQIDDLDSRISTLEADSYTKDEVYSKSEINSKCIRSVYSVRSSGNDTKTVSLPDGLYLVVAYQGGSWATAVWIYTATYYQSTPVLLTTNQYNITLSNDTPKTSTGTRTITVTNPSAASLWIHFYIIPRG